MMISARRLRWALAMLLLGVLVCPGAAADSRSLVARIKAVGKQGQGNAEAAKAWKELVAQGPAALFDILGAMDEDNSIQSNWLRPAVDAIAEKAGGAQSLPADKLEAFVKDKTNADLGRRVAYELLTELDKTAPERLLPGLLKDASSELRRDAVALAVKEATTLLKMKDKDAAKKAFQKALAGACDEDQVNAIAEQLKKLDVTVDLASHFGFVRGWRLIAPFDNSNATHFDDVNPPEKKVDLEETYKGKKDEEIRWYGFTTEDPHGAVDLNLLFGDWKGVTGYAFAVVESPEERRVQVRAGSNNAVKIFVNGKEVITHEEYHHGMRVDQYLGTVTLKAGRNEFLVKICQNEKKQSWEKDWKFQLRLTDRAGAAAPFTQQPVKSELTPRKPAKDVK
jgi:hypothetical protein